MIVYNVRIYTLDKANTVYENGFIEFDEKILRIGNMGDCPGITDDDLNGNGGLLYPGFIDGHSHVGVWGNAEGFEGDDGNESTDPSTPHLRAVDMVNPTDQCFTEAAHAGITTVVCGPGSANPIGGTFAAMKTMGSRRIDDRIIKFPAAVKFAFGENPKMAYRERSESPVTRMAIAAIIREQLYKAKRYLSAVDAHSKEPDTDLPEYDIKCEALIPLLRGEVKMHAHCHREDDIFTAVRIAEEFELELVIVHATDSELIAEELSKSNIPVIIGPVICERSKPELLSHSITTAGVLAEKGVKFAICTDHPVVPVQYLPLSAGLAIRGGLDVQGALRAITTEAAEICGISDRVGSLQPGKDADLVMFNGNFYDVLEVPAAVFVDGKRVKF
ncbi:MAG: amidohydrolase [Oscillospiraceae bacterium]|nr:amidohydrolase [Oscillospiraceae bacterium]